MYIFFVLIPIIFILLFVDWIWRFHTNSVNFFPGVNGSRFRNKHFRGLSLTVSHPGCGFSPVLKCSGLESCFSTEWVWHFYTRLWIYSRVWYILLKKVLFAQATTERFTSTVWKGSQGVADSLVQAHLENSMVVDWLGQLFLGSVAVSFWLFTHFKVV